MITDMLVYIHWLGWPLNASVHVSGEDGEALNRESHGSTDSRVSHDRSEVSATCASREERRETIHESRWDYS